MHATVRSFPGCTAKTGETATAFWRQLGRLRRLDVAGVPHILGAGVEPGGTPYVTIASVEGEPLDAWCDRHDLPLTARLRLFVEACDIVARVHARSIAHGALRMSRIVVGRDRRPRLLDLGIAMLTAACDPERETPVPTDDVFAMGWILYELTTGRRAGDVPSRRTVWDPDVRLYLESGLDAIVRRALRDDPGRRYPDAASFAADLRRHLSGLPVLVSFEEGAPPRRAAPPPLV